MSLKEIEDGIFLERKPSRHMQKVIEECGAKENIIMSHCINEKEKEDKEKWLDIYYPSITKRVFPIYENESKADTILEYCKSHNILLDEVIFVDDDFIDQLESKSVYWNDDLETIGTFVIKTIKRFETEGGKAFMPMYKDDEDGRFGEQLFSQTVQGRERSDELINRFLQTENWDVERVAFMDRVVMDTAITEILNYPAIPTRVTLNEYIEIAKYYSTPRSGQFVNGILNSIINHLKAEKIIVKE